MPQSSRSLEMGTWRGWQRGSDVTVGKSDELGTLNDPAAQQAPGHSILRGLGGKCL